MLTVEQLYEMLENLMAEGKGDYEVRVAIYVEGKGPMELTLTEEHTIHDEGIYLEQDFFYQELPEEVKKEFEW